MFGVLASEHCCMFKRLICIYYVRLSVHFPSGKAHTLKAVMPHKFVCAESVASKQKLPKLQINPPQRRLTEPCLECKIDLTHLM